MVSNQMNQTLHRSIRNISHLKVTIPILASIVGFIFFGMALIRLGGCPVANAAVTFTKLGSDRVYNDFVVGPGKVDVELSPGESRTFEITVANRLGSARTFMVSKEDFRGSTDPDQTVVLLGDDRSPYSLRDHISLSGERIELAQGVEAHIPVTISIPANAAPGGSYGSVIVSVLPEGTVSNAALGPLSEVITRVGTLFFVRVKGSAMESGHLDKFMIAGNERVFSDKRTILFDILYKNDGNVHLNPSGTVTVSNTLGRQVAYIKVDPWFALPQSLRFREVSWDPPFLLGRYVATVDIDLGYGGNTDKAEIVFWVIPWKTILLVILVMTIVIYVLRLVLHKMSGRNKRHNE